ncbi:MAG: hypothetical protein R6X19_09540, partial [Kiritimatiellia bacterium]
MKRMNATAWLVAVAMLVAGGAGADNRYWVGPDDGNWVDGANWSTTNVGGVGGAGVPGDYDDPFIFGSGIAQVSSSTKTRSPRIGVYAEDDAMVRVTGGTLTLSYVYMGMIAGAKGTLELSGGDLSALSITLGNASGATGIVLHTAGTVTLSGGITMIQAAGGSRYSMSGDTTSLSGGLGLTIGQGNVFEQDGGTSAFSTIDFKNSPNAAPTIRLKKGTLNITSTAGIQHSQASSLSIFEMGSNGVAVINETVAGTLLSTGRAGGSLSPRIFRGCGAVRFTGQLQNNGQVFADGWDGAEERDLDLTSFTSVTNDSGTSPVRGWWARNKAQLLLPTNQVATGDNSYNWGDSHDDTTLDVVNSLRMTFVNATEGALGIALLATNRAELGTTAGKIVGLWRFSPTPALTFDSVGLVFRYDNAEAAAQGVTEANLKIFKTVG